MATENTNSLLSFMESERAAAKEADDKKVEAEATSADADVVVEGEDEPVADSGSETDTESDKSPEPEVDTSAEPDKTPAEQAFLRAFLAKANIETEGIPDDELEAMVLAELKGASSDTSQSSDFGQTKGAEEKPAEVKDELAPQLPRKDVEESAKGDDSKQSASEREIARLEYDAKLAEYVTFEGDKAVPKEEYGEDGKAAARAINEYSAARRARVEKLVDDPVSYLMGDFKREMKALVAEELNNFRTEQQTLTQKQAQEQQAAIAAQREADAVAEIMRENKARFYEVGADGEPRRLFKSNTPVFTHFGKEVDKEFVELRDLNPHVPDSVLLAKAIRTVERYAAPKPKETTAAETAEKKKKFLEADRTVEKEREAHPATLSERLELGTGVNLLQAIMSDPDNVDNPAIAKLRQQIS